jgi:hypothetical protein
VRYALILALLLPLAAHSQRVVNKKFIALNGAQTHAGRRNEQDRREEENGLRHKTLN